MGTELMRVCVKEENDELPSVPPGFESYTSFTLKRVQDSEKPEIDDVTSEQSVKMETDSSTSDDATKITRSLRRRPSINYGGFDNDIADGSACQKLDQNFKVLKPCLPKGVIRGCSDCKDCQKVIARWRPENPRRPDLEDAPVFCPTEEEFEDTLRYIAKIRPKAEQYGICRIVPPLSWKPPCPLKEMDVWAGSKFATRVQRVDKLQNRDSMRKMSKLYNQMRKKRRRCMKMDMDCGINSGSNSTSDNSGICEPETFGFEPGPEFTMKEFQKYADEFKVQYFRRNENIKGMDCKVVNSPEQWEPSIENIEGEYWRIVEKATEEIEVLYGADLETGVFGSGFPKKPNLEGSTSAEKYVKSGWNLNNFPRLPGSVLSYESSDISGVLVPWLYIGMCFSSFCWHVEDHHLYSLNYMHWGAPKMWYGVAGKDALKLEQAMRKHLPDLFEEQPDLLHKLVTQLSPYVLKMEGVPVFRCVQNAGEFILTFPRAYHAGFNCGFNCAEAVNVAPVDWLPHGQIAIELYYQQGRKTSISHDKLLLGAARDAVKAHWELNLLKKNTSDNLRWKEFCGKDGILAKALKSRVEMEHSKRQFLCNSSLALKMHSNFDATNERECCVCFFDLHLSAAGCRCSPEKYSCLNHVKQLCSCPWVTKYFLFRYDIDELNILVEALEGKLSAVYRWARQDLGLALSAHVSSNNMKTDKLYTSLEDKVPKDSRLQEPAISVKNLQVKEISREFTSKDDILEINSQIKSKPSEVGLLVKDTKEPSASNLCSKPVKEESIFLSLDSKAPISRPSQGRTFSAIDLAVKQCEGKKKASESAHENIIFLSDDEDDEPQKMVLALRTRENSSEKHLELVEKLAHFDDRVNQHRCNEDKTSTASAANATSVGQKNANSVLDAKAYESNTPNSISQVKIKAEVDGIAQDLSNTRETNSLGCGKTNNSDKHERAGPLVISDLVDVGRNNSGTPSCSKNNLDRPFRPKGPRIAKVVRRINCNVEPLAFGSVVSGKSWCSSRSIFPKGFRSRVRYINVLNPTNMCYYVSEILDAGLDGPLFMVYLEHYPSEVFIHVSANRCWEMVRDRVNQEIAKQHKAGKTELPPLQPPGSLDGFEMFGFSSPAIVQAIEALDRNRVCTEYWDSRPYSRPPVQLLPVQLPQISHPKETNSTQRSSKVENNINASTNHLSPLGIDTVLRGLFKKANPEELHSLQSVLSDPNMVARLVNEEIQNRHW